MSQNFPVVTLPSHETNKFKSLKEEEGIKLNGEIAVVWFRIVKCDGLNQRISSHSYTAAPNQMICGRVRTTATCSGNSKEHLLVELKAGNRLYSANCEGQNKSWLLTCGETPVLWIPRIGKSLLSGPGGTFFTTTWRFSVQREWETISDAMKWLTMQFPVQVWWRTAHRLNLYATTHLWLQ